MKLNELVKHLTVGKNWKEIGCDHIVTITEISGEIADSTMVAFESDCCVSSSPLEMFLKDFTPVINNDMSKSDSETKLKELLKTGRVKCIFDSGMLYLTKGKSYNVLGEYDGVNILVIDDLNMAVPYPLSYFEPINIKSH